MKNRSGLKNSITSVICLLFCIYVIGYELYNRDQARTMINQHARIIAEALWNMDSHGASEYLQLAADSHHYKTLTVSDTYGEIFQQVSCEDPPPLQNILEKLRLAPQLHLAAEVRYRDQIIGNIEAAWISFSLLTHIYVFFALSLLTAVLHLYLRVKEDKKILEERVASRTAELAKSNRSLLMEIHQKRKTTATLRKSEEGYRTLYKESKNAEEVYRSLIHSSADAILICDLDMQVVDLSAAFSNLFGWSLEDVKGRTIDLVAEPEREAVAAMFTKLRHDGKSCKRYEAGAVSRNGSVFDISISCSRFNDHTGQPTGIMVVLRDISDRIKLEKKLYQTERMEAIGTLAGGIAHDFNNLLMGIQGNVSLALIDIQPASQLHDRLTTISTYVKNGADLTKQLLGFARGGKYEVKSTNINELLESENRMFSRTRKDITIHEDYQDDIWPVEVDQGQIKQILLNLYVNASHAMPGGGDIFISTHNITLRDVSTRAYTIFPGRYVRISITDTGIGMDKPTQAKIFDPFFTTKDMGGGTGLGLATVYGIIKNHNGFIEVYSEVGEGTTFQILLPVSDKQITTEQPITADFSPGAGTILLVDDEQMILDVGTEMLKVIGYQVFTVNSGREACEFYAANCDTIDLIILDMIMPDMDGGKVFDRLKETNSKAKVILSSGYSLNSKASEIIDRGCDGFLQKPFDLSSLSAKLQEVQQNTNTNG